MDLNNFLISDGQNIKEKRERGRVKETGRQTDRGRKREKKKEK